MPAKPRYLPPGPPTVTMTDRFGDALQISPDGGGHVLFSILPEDPDTPGMHVSLPIVWIPALFTQVVKATGMDPAALTRLAQAEGYVKRQPNRAERRAAPKPPKTGQSFRTTEIKEF